MSLFGNPVARAGGGARTNSSRLVEFRAGKMNYTESTKMVTPDTRKGLLYIHRSNDMLMHFCWKERTSADNEEDLIIFPSETKFKKVTSNKTGRVYVLRFESTGRKLFFWMQEPNEEKDEELCNKVNEALNDPPAPGALLGGSTATAAAPGGDSARLAAQLGMTPEEVAAMFGAEGMQQLENVLQGASGDMYGDVAEADDDFYEGYEGDGNSANATAMDTSADAPAPTTDDAPTPSATATLAESATTTTPATATTTTSASAPAAAAAAATTTTTTTATTASTTSSAATPLASVDLAKILQNIGAGGSTGTSSAAGTEDVDLSSIITPATLKMLMEDEKVSADLIALLPEDLKSASELQTTVRTPQFQQALNSLESALRSGQFTTVLSHFGIDGQSVFSVQRLVEAVQKSVDEKKKTGSAPMEE